MGKVVKKVAPIALSLAAPGFGTAIGTALGATGVGASVLGNSLVGAGLGAIGGGGVKGALLGGVTGGLGSSGLGSSIGGALGATGPVASAIGNGLVGAGLGAATGGGLEGALLGGAGGALSGYVKGGGEVPGLGRAAGASLDQTTGIPGLQGPTRGTGGLGSLTSGGLGSLTTGGQPVKLGSLFDAGSTAFDLYQGQKSSDDIEDIVRRQAALAQQQYQPYATAGRTALQNLQAPSLEALQNDPGYQFRLQQGQQALERSLGAAGLNKSGAALKRAQQYGQGLADQTYNDFFNRQSSIANQGYNASTGLANIAAGLSGNLAEIEANRFNNYSQGLSRLGGLFG